MGDEGSCSDVRSISPATLCKVLQVGVGGDEVQDVVRGPI